jgi:uncharacterized membrane protein (UPF0127 family)
MACGLLLLILSGLGIYSHLQQPASTDNKLTLDRKLQAANHLFYITIASTPQQQAKGLGGISSLESDQGMYFPLTGQSGVSFWMKDMIMPIDIIWIKQGSIIGINGNVPAPTTGIPDNQLTHYTSPVANPDAVLEIAANQSKLLNLQVGDPITLLPEQQ